MEDTGRPTEVSLEFFAHLGRGVRPERAGVRSADVFQQQQKRPERVSMTTRLIS